LIDIHSSFRLHFFDCCHYFPFAAADAAFAFSLRFSFASLPAAMPGRWLTLISRCCFHAFHDFAFRLIFACPTGWPPRFLSPLSPPLSLLPPIYHLFSAIMLLSAAIDYYILFFFFHCFFAYYFAIAFHCQRFRH
jgi:hypothetical protein